MWRARMCRINNTRPPSLNKYSHTGGEEEDQSASESGECDLSRVVVEESVFLLVHKEHR